MPSHLFSFQWLHPWNMRTCWYALQLKPKNQRGKRQTLKMLFSLWRPLIMLELTFNDVHIRKMKCLVVLAYGLAFQKLWSLVVAINNVTQFSLALRINLRILKRCWRRKSEAVMKPTLKVSKFNFQICRVFLLPGNINFALILYITQATERRLMMVKKKTTNTSSPNEVKVRTETWRKWLIFNLSLDFFPFSSL